MRAADGVLSSLFLDVNNWQHMKHDDAAMEKRLNMFQGLLRHRIVVVVGRSNTKYN